jgi:hypothetical protein
LISIDIFKESASLLYKNPILFLLPSIGSVISVVSEAFFVIGLRNNNNQNYFPFSDIVILFLFFISFTITYFQLVVIARKVILKIAFKSMNYNVKVVELFLIYSIYALALVNIGDYESDIRKSFVVKSDRFSLYTYKINGYHNTISIIIPSGIFIVLLSAIISIFFNAWMVEYMLIGDQNMSSRYGLYESFKNIFNLVIRERDNKRKKIASLFLVTILILIIEFILTNIAIVYSIADSLNLYIFQYIALNIIGAVYSPFFLICLFLILLSRTFR